MAWTSPTSRTTGELVTASIWNTDLVDDLIYLYSGGIRELYIPVAAFRPHTANGCGALESVLLSSSRYVSGCPFDGAAVESATMVYPFPKSWNEATITFQPYWFNTAGGSGNVIWGVQGVATGDNETMDVGVGSTQTSTDTVLAAKYCAVGPESASITFAGSPDVGDLVRFLLYRDGASDSYNSDAYLMGIKIRLATDEPYDT